MTTPRRWKNWGRAVALGAALMAMGGCAATDAIPVPKFSSVKRITKRLLSSDEQNAEIRDLTLEQKQHREQAERELEKR